MKVWYRVIRLVSHIRLFIYKIGINLHRKRMKRVQYGTYAPCHKETAKDTQKNS